MPAPISTARVTSGRRIAATLLSVALVLGTGGAPMSAAERPTRSGDPDIVRSELTPAQALRARAADARALYARAVAEAKEARNEALATPRAERDAGLESAGPKAERRAVRRAYRTTVAPIKAEYKSAKRAAKATRKATIDEALAEYLVATGQPEVMAALKDYRKAVTAAGTTVELALRSGRETFRTDTADERAQLVSDLEQADSQAERTEAWKDFVAGTAEEVAAHASSIAAARATYRSALAKARAEFALETGDSIRTLLRLPFKV